MGIGVGCTSPGAGGVESGTTGSGGGTWGFVAIKLPLINVWLGVAAPVYRVGSFGKPG